MKVQQVISYRLYQHIKECEKQVLLESITSKNMIKRIQSGEVEDSLRTMLESQPMFILEMTMSLLGIFATPGMAEQPGALKLALRMYIQGITGKTVCGLINTIMAEVMKLWTEFSTLTGLQSSEDMEGKNPVTQLRKIFEQWELMKSHPLAKKLVKIFHYTLGTCLLEKFGITYDTFWFSKAEAEASQRTHNSNYGFMGAILDGVLHLLERLYDVQKTGTWQPLLHTGSEYGSWVDEVYKLQELSQLLHNPEANNFSYHEYVSRVNMCIEKGEAICKYSVDLDSSARMSAKRYLSSMRLLKADYLTKTAARQMRDTPFSLLLFGGSGLGKSSLVSAIYSYFGKLHNLPGGDEHIYTRCFSDEYWSGFTSAVWCLVLDDIAARNPDLKDDKSMDEIIQIVNMIPTNPPQADLADKGRTPLKPKLVIGTTNVKNISAHAYYQSDLAIRRRFPYVITVHVKKEFSKDPYAKPYDRMLDPAKVDTSQPLPNLWDFKIEKVIAVPSLQEDMPQTAQLTMVEMETDIYGLLKFLGQESKSHFINQEKAKESKSQFDAMSICDTCLCVKQYEQCDCTLQSAENSVHQDVLKSLKIKCWDEIMNISSHSLEFLSTYSMPLTIVGCSLALAQGCAFYDWRNVRNQYRNLGYKVQADVYDYAGRFLKTVAKDIMKQEFHKVLKPMDKVKNNTLKYVKRHKCYLTYVRSKLAKSMLTFQERYDEEKRLMREFFVKQGDRVRKSMISNRWLLSLIVGLPTIYGVYKLYKSWNDIVPQASTVEGTKIEAHDEKPNPWFRDEYEPAPFDIGRKTSSWKCLKFDEILSKLQNNVIHTTFQFERPGKGNCYRTSRSVCVTGSLYVTTNHSIPDDIDNITIKVVTMVGNTGINGNFTKKMSQGELYRNVEKDLVFFRLGNMPPKKSIVDCFARDTFKTVCRGVKIIRNEDGSITNLTVDGIRSHTHFVNDLQREFTYWSGVSPVGTEDGTCGSPLVGDTPQGPVILGLHQLGAPNTKNTSSVKVTQQDILDAISYFDILPVEGSSPDLTDVVGEPIPLGPIHHKSPLRWIDHGVANAYGSIQTFIPKHTSKVTDTYIRKEMEEIGYEVKTGAPQMRGWKPWYLGIESIVQQEFTADQSIIDKCVKAFSNDIINRLTDIDTKEIVILTDGATINGLPGVKYIDKMNRNTSMGWPYNKKKKFYLCEPYAFEDWSDYVDFDDEFYVKVNEIIALYQNGKRAMPIFMGHLKDEALPFKKIEDEATRLFCGGPCPWSFVVRKYLLSVVRVLQNNRFTFEAAPGTNCCSSEWEEMFRYLTAFGQDRMIAGDFSKFDKRMSAQWIIASFKVIDNILQYAGWEINDRRIVQCIAHDIAFPLCNLNGDLIEFWGSNPSGHPLTVIVNSLVNALYMRYAWYKGGNNLKDFKDQVNLMTYGDDNVMGVSELAKNFDHTVIQREMADIGVKYTMADKTSVSVPFINIYQLEFLKRKWRWEPELEEHVAQLNEDSIAKMLTKCIPSKVVCKEQQAVDLLHGALQEYFYYGRDTFDAKRETFLKVIKQKELEPYYVRDFSTYDDILIQYKENSKDFSYRY